MRGRGDLLKRNFGPVKLTKFQIYNAKNFDKLVPPSKLNSRARQQQQQQQQSNFLDGEKMITGQQEQLKRPQKVDDVGPTDVMRDERPQEDVSIDKRWQQLETRLTVV